MSTADHYAIVCHGDPDATVRARFPRGTTGSLDECRGALARWRDRAGSLAGAAEAACSVRIVGPYATRAAARRADISTGHEARS